LLLSLNLYMVEHIRLFLQQSQYLLIIEQELELKIIRQTK
jgi:hypothetical protein